MAVARALSGFTVGILLALLLAIIGPFILILLPIYVAFDAVYDEHYGWVHIKRLL